MKPNKKKIAEHFAGIMTELGLDLKDESLKGTPDRVAKMYVNEFCSGLNEDNEPKITTFPNDKEYNQMLVEKNITIYSMCEHHFVPIVGKCHIAYIPGRKVIGLSKLIRVAQFFSRKPQLQERLTQEIAEYLSEKLGTADIAVIIDAEHFCCKIRGAQDPNSSTVTSHIGGKFLNGDVRRELFDILKI